MNVTAKLIKKILLIFMIALAGVMQVACTDSSFDESDEKINTSIMYIYINNNKLEVTLYESKTTKALIELLTENDIVYNASEYGGFEIVGDIKVVLPNDDKKITTTIGDVVLYQSRNIVLFFGSNTWQYTRIGKINSSNDEIINALRTDEKNIEVRLSLK